MSTDASHTPCRNCGTVLQGPYCHVCGQHGHDPLRSFGHAVEDVFESFWHLDGRVFATLRDLLVPGRLAAAYLDGRRARYLPPLRLFLILTVLTFFLGKLTLHIAPQDGAQPAEAEIGTATQFTEIDTARRPEDVLAAHAAVLRELEQGETPPGFSWLVPVVRDLVRGRAQQAAEARLRALDATPQAFARLQAQAAASMRSNPQAAVLRADAGLLERWQAERAQRLRENIGLIERDPDAFIRMLLGALPGALFVLVPVFALCLKALYLRRRMGYLQHLIVALYSHSAMLLALLASFLAAALDLALPWDGVNLVTGLLLGLGVPVYLLLMQKRVYAQGWAMTVLKYLLLGGVYVVLLGLTLSYAAVAGLIS